MTTPSRLLISVRSADEAAIALAAGADLIDVKEPSNGPLGIAHHEVLAAVLATVKGAVPVSAALGEWTPNALTDVHWHLQLPVQFIKWGLAGYGNKPGWGEDLLDMRRQIRTGTEVVLVAYADWEKAKSPPPVAVVQFAKRFRYKAVLIDTFLKDGSTLLDSLPLPELTGLLTSLKAGRIPVALGGSLKIEQLKQLKPLAPDWFAVRGAVCAGGTREGLLDPVRIQKWKAAPAG